MSTIKTVGKLRYDPNKILGRGRFGTVFSGSHVYFDGSMFRPAKSFPVAVKRIDRILVVDESVIRWEEEVMKKTSNHPNTLKHIHTERNEDFVFIAMELCSGTLEDYVKNKYLGPRFQNEREILRQATRGLVHLHNLGIVHRDIKPKNILIFVPPSEGAESKPQIKLADFDISKLLKADKTDFTNTSKTNPKGTRGWMAPEVYESDRFDFKVDIWALGLVFAFTLSGGKHPFGDDDEDKRSIRIKQNEPMIFTRDDLMEVYRNGGAFELIKLMLKVEANNRPMVTDVLKDSFLKDEIRTAEFLDVCKSFRESITNDKIVKFKELVKDETVDVNATTITLLEGEMNPLYLVCRYYVKDNLIELVKDLLLNGANVNSRTKDVNKMIGTGVTPLYFLLCLYKNRKMVDIVQLLLENGADVNAKDEHEWTPLHILCINNYQNDNLEDIAQLLIEKGADVNSKGLYGQTPLHCLCRFYKWKSEMNERDKRFLQSLVLVFVEKGANINAKDEKGETPADILRKRDVDLKIFMQ